MIETLENQLKTQKHEQTMQRVFFEAEQKAMLTKLNGDSE